MNIWIFWHGNAFENVAGKIWANHFKPQSLKLLKQSRVYIGNKQSDGIPLIYVHKMEIEIGTPQHWIQACVMPKGYIVGISFFTFY